jgi:hypothetical protein
MNDTSVVVEIGLIAPKYNEGQRTGIQVGARIVS